LASLREALAGQIAMPAMVSLSFGVFDAAMQAPENKAIANDYKRHLKTLDDKPGATLESLRGLIQDLTLPERIYQSLESKASDQGLILPGERETVRQCITSVWASMWTERAYWSRRRLGIEHDAVRLAVLIQAVIDFDYAFVLHTANPMTGQRDEMYGELVCGLGETLVGNAPGQPLAFVADKQSRALRLMTMPSKSIALHGRGTIFRSDSNAEDLPGYAGAGLYESHLSEPATETRIDYTQQPLVQDPAYRERVLLQLVELGLRLEEQMGAAQDIEGGIANEQCYLVQTRPQVGLD
jgi:alpha-glucan,water dikinase